jgi:hypothetical protein
MTAGAARMLILIALLQSAGISGNVPVGVGPLEPPGRVLWLPAHESDEARKHECVLAADARWSCPSVPAGQSGVAVMVGNGVIGYVIHGQTGATANGSADWGRLVRVAPGGVGAENLSDLRVSPWTVDRPPSRPNTLKLDAIPDTAYQVIKVSATSYWVSGPVPSPDAFLQVEGANIARHDTRMASLAEGPPDSPFLVEATSGVSITGRVETRSGEPVEGALLELFTTAPTADNVPGDEKALATIPIVRLATTAADEEGRFEFSGLENGLYQVVAIAFSRGRLSRWTTTASPPLLMRLEPPARVTGRVLRQKLPARGVTVRFVPTATAWRNSDDPSAHLTADVVTEESGRFALPLPPRPAGDIQFIAPDGASTRVVLPTLSKLSEIALGDVALPEFIAVEIRADVPGCRMSAVGPAGALGFVVSPGRATSTIYQFDLPEAGQWFLDAECAGQHVSLQPPAIDVKSTRSLALFDVHVITADTTRSPRWLPPDDQHQRIPNVPPPSGGDHDP